MYVKRNIICPSTDEDREKALVAMQLSKQREPEHSPLMMKEALRIAMYDNPKVATQLTGIPLKEIATFARHENMTPEELAEEHQEIAKKKVKRAGWTSEQKFKIIKDALKIRQETRKYLGRCFTMAGVKHGLKSVVAAKLFHHYLMQKKKRANS